MRISQRNKKSNESTLTVTERFSFPFESAPLKISGRPEAWYRLYALSAKLQELGNFMDCQNCGWPLWEFHEYMHGDEEPEEMSESVSTNPLVLS
jgi:hypothetical protein